MLEVAFDDTRRRYGLIPEAGFHAPESGWADVNGRQGERCRTWKINKNKGISYAGLMTANGYQAAWCNDVDAFRMTICTNLRARGKGLAPGFVKVVPTCL